MITKVIMGTVIRMLFTCIYTPSAVYFEDTTYDITVYKR